MVWMFVGSSVRYLLVTTCLYVLIGSSTGSDQSKEVIFPESPSPSFLTVPGEGFAEPFELTPGKWIIYLRAEGVLLVS